MSQQHRADTAVQANRVWGSFDLQSGRYGETRVRVRIFSPHITAQERFVWHLLHVWPVVGLLLGAVAAVGVSGLASPSAAWVVGLSVWVLPLIAIWVVAQPLIATTAEHWATIDCAGNVGPEADELIRLAHRLDEVQARRDAGQIDDAEFLQAWEHAHREPITAG